MSKITKRIAKRSTASMEESQLIPIEQQGKNETSGLRSETSSQAAFNESFYPGRCLVLSTFNGQTLVHVREYQTSGVKQYPTKKGATFTGGRLAMLRRSIEGINAALHQQEVNASCNVTVQGGVLYMMHLGAAIYASVNEKFHGVDLRRYWMPEGQLAPVPTKNGIYLPAKQWKKLVKKLDQLLAEHPELLLARECSLSHDNQMGMIECRECMPFGWTL